MSIRTKKIVVGVVLAVAAALIGIYLFLDSIIAKEWEGKRAAVIRAYEETMLVKAEKVERFAGAESYSIVYGEDKLGKKMIVWVGETEVYSAYESDGMSKEAIMEKAASAAPDGEIIRATPGKLGSEYVWELYSKREENGVSGYFYDYYRFSDGEHIDTYRLGRT